MFLLYLHANSVQNQKRGKKASSGGESSPAGTGIAMDFTLKELYAIQEIQEQKNLFRLLVGYVISLQSRQSDCLHLLQRWTISVLGDAHILNKD